jgi:hypothetical protein
MRHSLFLNTTFDMWSFLCSAKAHKRNGLQREKQPISYNTPAGKAYGYRMTILIAPCFNRPSKASPSYFHWLLCKSLDWLVKEKAYCRTALLPLNSIYRTWSTWRDLKRWQRTTSDGRKAPSSTKGKPLGRSPLVLTLYYCYCLVWWPWAKWSSNWTTGNKQINETDHSLTLLLFLRAKHIPYRDSKLTRILSSSLSGNDRVAVICTINPAWRSKDESTNTLRFAQSVKKVRINPRINLVSLFKCVDYK